MYSVKMDENNNKTKMIQLGQVCTRDQRITSNQIYLLKSPGCSFIISCIKTTRSLYRAVAQLIYD